MTFLSAESKVYNAKEQRYTCLLVLRDGQTK